MKYLQRLGRSLMLPVATLPVAAILMGIGYWIDPTGWGANNIVAAVLLSAGGAIIDNMGILFAIGIAFGMSDDGRGEAALAGLVSFLMLIKMLSPGVVGMLKGIEADAVDIAFSKIGNGNQFIGIVAGLIAATCYNKFKNTKLPQALGFFSGRRAVAIVTALVALLASIVLLFVWPPIYNALIAFGVFIIALGPLGAGIYAFLNRLLIPFGLHHALNSVFWFDLAGIDDIGKFWGNKPGGVFGETGMYMTGFFPIMMFALPAAALAMYHTSKKERKEEMKGQMLSVSLSSFFTGITEPIEFSFMFLAPALYATHAVLTGIAVGITAALPIRAGFNFSAGFVDWFLSLRVPLAQNPLLIIPLGLVFAVIYYFIFRFMIVKFNIKTPGREDDVSEEEKTFDINTSDYDGVAGIILEGLGGKDNIDSIDNCVTRLRIEVKDNLLVDEAIIKKSGAPGVIRPAKNSVQVVIGTHVEHVAEAFKKLL